MSFGVPPSEASDRSNVIGDCAIPPFMVSSAVDLIEFGVPALEDGSLVGEMDLARSIIVNQMPLDHDNAFTAKW